MPTRRRPNSDATSLLAAALVAACSSPHDVTPPNPNLPCAGGGAVQLSVAQATVVSCSNGGTTVTLGGGGASYLVIPQFATDQGPNQLVAYSLTTGNAAPSSIVATRAAAAASAAGGLVSPIRANTPQLAADRALRAKARALALAGAFKATTMRARGLSGGVSLQALPPVGSIRSFRVLSSFSATPAWKSVAAQLVYLGSNVLVYVDTVSAGSGFNAAQLQAFGALMDQTLFPIDTAAFGQPSDVDQNGHVIMLMSPVVNADTPLAQCGDGYVAGFFDGEDFNGASDPNSNQGEIFYSVVPDPSGVYSCSHSVGEVSFDVPGTFLHELQHLIDFSQHVVLTGGQPESSWLDEGLSLVAEELGSAHYEQKCPPPLCRTSSAQLFPDSSTGFVKNFVNFSYLHAVRPDTASLTLHLDSDGGFSWRGGDWALMRWLGDQMGSGFYKKLEHGVASGVTNIANAAGQSFPSLFGNFGIALYTDSLPGLPRNTSPAINRFVTRNMRILWTVGAGPAVGILAPYPLHLDSLTSTTPAAVMDPGAMSFWRLDTPAGASTVTIRFSTLTGNAFSAAMQPQLAIFRLPP